MPVFSRLSKLDLHTSAFAMGSRQALAWPSSIALTRLLEKSHWSHYVKGLVRGELSRPFQEHVLEQIHENPAWQTVFKRHPQYFHAAQSHYVDRRRGMRKRFASMGEDLRVARHLFGEALSHRIAHGEQISLCPLFDDRHLALGLNELCGKEGLWTLTIRDTKNHQIYGVTFSFLSPDALLVSTIQGPHQSLGGSDLIKDAKKKAFGIRPTSLLMSLLRVLCQEWGIKYLYGISPLNHVKGQWNQRSKHLRFDYVRFWQEQSGKPDRSGHWISPVEHPFKEIEQVPANKRANYKRRLGFIAQSSDTIRETLKAWGASPA
jgi:uncharacterized protein